MKKKRYYCIESNCNNDIHYYTWKYGSGLCRSCGAKYKKPHQHDCQCFCCKAKRGEYKGKNTSRYIDGRTNKKYYCIICGKEITIYSKSGMCGSCCQKDKKISTKSRSKLSLTLGGTGIPYENTEYGAEFDNALKEQVRFRDKYTCQICGCSQLENGKQLDVHHIDYDKKNNNPKYLISLCRKCHMKTNYNRNYWIKYFLDKIKKILKGGG